MEFRTQDNEMKTSGSFSYGHLSKESAGGERKQVGNHNGTNATQTLDYPHDFQQQQLNHGFKDPNQDRFTQIGGKPKSKNPSNSTVKYRECLKNHAATIGGNVFDGCGEFMPSGEEGTLEALKCAACECHRNFHRKEIDGESHHYGSPSSRLSSLVLSPHHHHHHHQKFSMGFHGNPNNAPVIVQPMSVAFGGGGGGGNESSSEDLNVFQSSGEAVLRSPPFSLSKKRYRTKFTQEQKDKMLEFAEKLEWRFQKQEEDSIERFCAEVGVKRQVFKVWMHNNKSSNIKKQNESLINQSLEPILEPASEERVLLDR